MHMIPARDPIRKQRQSLRSAAIARLQGYLVDVSHPSRWNWRASRSRSDSGQGSCGAFYLEQVAIETGDS